MIGIVTVVLSVLATITWILIFALVDWDEIDDSNDDRSTTTRSTSTPVAVLIRVAAVAVRLLG